MRLHDHKVPNQNLDHNPYGRGPGFEPSLPPCERNQSGSESLFKWGLGHLWRDYDWPFEQNG